MKRVTEATAQLLHLREIKREASRRCRARAKAIANGELLTPELAIRSLQPTAMKLENFKAEVGSKAVRLNKNGASGTVLVITEKTPSGVIKTRKSFKLLKDAVKAFNEVVR